MNLKNELTNVVIDDPEFAGDEQRKFVFAGSGSPAPDLNLEDLQNRKFEFKSEQGRATGMTDSVLDFLQSDPPDPDPVLGTVVLNQAQYKELRESAQGRKFLDRTGVLDFLEEREEDILAEATKGMNRKQRRTFLSQYRKNKKHDHLRKA